MKKQDTQKAKSTTVKAPWNRPALTLIRAGAAEGTGGFTTDGGLS